MDWNGAALTLIPLLCKGLLDPAWNTCGWDAVGSDDDDGVWSAFSDIEAWIWSIDSFCGRCSAVWEGWYMGWEAVYPSLVEETKGTWQNKPQSPQKSADAHTQFCKKYQRPLDGWYSLVCEPADLHNQYKLVTSNHQHSNMTQLQAQTQVDTGWLPMAWILCFMSSALTQSPRKTPASKAEGFALKAVLGSLRGNG